MDTNRLEDATLEKMSQEVEKVIEKILAESKSSKCLQTDLLFVVLLTFAIENGFAVLEDEIELVKLADFLDPNCLQRWKSNSDVYTCLLSLNGFKSLSLRFIMSPLGNAVAVNIIIEEMRKETYSVCLPVSRYIAAPNAPTVPRIFRELKHLSSIVKNKLLNPVKGRVLNYFGLPSASLIGLPKELILKIIQYCDIHTIVKLSATCTEINKTISDQMLWKKICLRDFPHMSLSIQIDWKEYYVQMYLSQRESRNVPLMVWDYSD